MKIHPIPIDPNLCSHQWLAYESVPPRWEQDHGIPIDYWRECKLCGLTQPISRDHFLTMVDEFTKPPSTSHELPMKICRDCLHYVYSDSNQHGCLHSAAPVTNCVTGDLEVASCITLRADRDLCGPAGVWWEAKKTESDS